MPKSLSFNLKSESGHKYNYALEVIYKESHLPTTLSIFFATTSYKKVEGKGFMIDSQRTFCYNFDYHSGRLNYVSHHKGDFTKPGFSWADTRIAQFEYDKVREEHRGQGQKTAQRVYNYLQEEKRKSVDSRWQEKHDSFLSPLEKIVLKK